MALRNYLAPPAPPTAGGGPWALPPSPEQRDKVEPLGKGAKPPCHAGYCRVLEAPEALSRWGAKPPCSDCQLWQFGGYLTSWIANPSKHPNSCGPGCGLEGAF
jgi:hypothetical protein